MSRGLGCGLGLSFAPPRGLEGEQKFGLTIGERVEVVADEFGFNGWHGHILAFEGSLVAINLDEPPPGHSSNGQWFDPKKVRSDPR